MVRRATVFALTGLTSLGLVTLSSVIRAQAQFLPTSLWEPGGVLLAQSVNSPVSSDSPQPSTHNPVLLTPGTQSGDVLLLQQQLQRLGYYNGPLDGAYGSGTRSAVQGFQAQTALPATGSLDQATWQRMQVPQVPQSGSSPSPQGSPAQAQPPGLSDSSSPSSLPGALGGATTAPNPAPAPATSATPAPAATLTPAASPVPAPSATPNNSAASAPATPASSSTGQPGRRYVWWAIAILSLLLISASAVSLTLAVWQRRSQRQGDPLAENEAFGTGSSPTEPEAVSSSIKGSGSVSSADAFSPVNPDSQVAPSDTALVPVPRLEETTRLSRVNITDELVADLVHQDANQRHKAIWELGQRGNSTAIQPLVDAMLDADSQERSLILAALSEIGMRTLKPMNRALAVSLQDENPEVRKNAIRDLTRVYDQISQISQMLSRAVQDSDSEVQETAQWALEQLGRVRLLTGPSLPAAENSESGHYLNDDSSRSFRS